MNRGLTEALHAAHSPTTADRTAAWYALKARLLPPVEAQAALDAWRAENPNIATMWCGVDPGYEL